MNVFIFSLATAVVLLTGYGCTQKPDSTRLAEKANDSLIEQVLPEQEKRLAANTKSNTKDVAEFMVSLANSSHTAQALSELAIERATHPDIKAYARQTLKQQQKHEADLTEAARMFNIILPKTLSDDSQTLLKRLRDEKPGSDFDRVYLRYIVDVTDAVGNKTKNLAKNADSPGLKVLAQTIAAEDKKLMQDAQKLKEKVK